MRRLGSRGAERSVVSVNRLGLCKAPVRGAGVVWLVRTGTLWVAVLTKHNSNGWWGRVRCVGCGCSLLLLP